MTDVLVVGLGEIGQPLMDVLGNVYEVTGKDLEPIEATDTDVMHICYPYIESRFEEASLGYIDQFEPQLTIINSTVPPGTTRQISNSTSRPIVYSPVRGKHYQMSKDLLSYTKFVASENPHWTEEAQGHFTEAGLSVASMSSPETLELAKLLETTYFGLLIAWAQEMERICSSIKVDYYECMRFTEEIAYLPPVTFQPGYIGGHCVMPNISLLETVKSSDFLNLIRESNEKKRAEWVDLNIPLEKRLRPKPLSEGDNDR